MLFVLNVCITNEQCVFFYTPFTGDSLYEAVLSQLETPPDYTVMSFRKQIVYFALQNQNLLHGFLSDFVKKRKDNMESYLTNMYNGKLKNYL